MAATCRGGHAHSERCERQAGYPAALCKAMAGDFHEFWQDTDVVLAEADLLVAAREHDPRPETLLVNSVATELQWDLEYSNWFQRRSRYHINVNELRSTTALIRDAAIHDPGTRQMYLQDSRVAAGALSKGRSAAPQLNRELRLVLPVHPRGPPCAGVRLHSFPSQPGG